MAQCLKRYVPKVAICIPSAHGRSFGPVLSDRPDSRLQLHLNLHQRMRVAPIQGQTAVRCRMFPELVSISVFHGPNAIYDRTILHADPQDQIEAGI